MAALILKTREAGPRQAVEQAAHALESGGLVILPTDTVYGLAADARLPDSEDRLYRAKERDRGKPIPLLAACLDDVMAFGAVLGVTEHKLARAFWPGPLTLVLKTRREGAERLEGFRVPDDMTAQDVVRATGGVLRVTSANVSGQPPALTAGEAGRALGSRVAVILDTGPVPGGTPSTVVKVVDEEIVILRPGAIDRASLQAAVDAIPEEGSS